MSGSKKIPRPSIRKSHGLQFEIKSNYSCSESLNPKPTFTPTQLRESLGPSGFTMTPLFPDLCFEIGPLKLRGRGGVYFHEPHILTQGLGFRVEGWNFWLRVWVWEFGFGLGPNLGVEGSSFEEYLRTTTNPNSSLRATNTEVRQRPEAGFWLLVPSQMHKYLWSMEAILHHAGHPYYYNS